jgi:hypothetical protein
MDLVDHWVVAFSGKRQLSNPEKLRTALRNVLQELQNLPHTLHLPDKRLVAISSVAMGADLLFVDEVLRTKIPWICVLPFPKEAFFNEKDFPDLAERERAQQNLSQAADCEIVECGLALAGKEESAWRSDAFKQAGFLGVDEADVFIAVLHETAEQSKPGGTAEVVAYARAKKRPLIIIDPLSFETRRENWPPTFLDCAVQQQLSDLGKAELPEQERSSLPTAAAITTAGWRSSWAQAARRYVPAVRRRTSYVVVFHAVATIITAYVFLLLETNQHLARAILEISFLLLLLTGLWFTCRLLWKWSKAGAANYRLAIKSSRRAIATWVIITAYLFLLLYSTQLFGKRVLETTVWLLLCTGFCFFWWLIKKQPQVSAANYRLAAELGRSIIATWAIPGAAPEIVRSLPREFRPFSRNLILHQRLDPDRRRIAPTTAEDLQKLVCDYRENRIKPQVHYYRREYEKAKRRSRRGEVITLLLSGTAVLCAFFLVLDYGSESAHSLLGFAKLAAATLTSMMVGVMVIYEVKRREARYEQMLEALKYYKRETRQVRTIANLQNLVIDVERMLLSESQEWWVLAKANAAV